MQGIESDDEKKDKVKKRNRPVLGDDLEGIFLESNIHCQEIMY